MHKFSLVTHGDIADVIRERVAVKKDLIDESASFSISESNIASELLYFLRRRSNANPSRPSRAIEVGSGTLTVLIEYVAAPPNRLEPLMNRESALGRSAAIVLSVTDIQDVNFKGNVWSGGRAESLG